MEPGSSNSKPADLLTRRDLVALVTAVLIAAVIYLSASTSSKAFGFPLDDSWIHQTYARSLAQHGEWAFRPGLPSAGSTSPLWSALLAPSFLLGLPPQAWTFFLGLVLLFFLAALVEWALRKMSPGYRPQVPWAGLFIALEWHMDWAALSGMETLFHALLVTAVLVQLMTGSKRYLALGLLAGLSVWVRPDGLTLLGPVLLALWLSSPDLRTRLRTLVAVLVGFGSLFALYLLFNLLVGGTPMPNTFYAKQVEYAAWQARPLLEKLGQLALQLLVGPALLLVPGLVLWLNKALRRRDWPGLASLAWCFGYLLLYILRLPAYQHGRYLMPAMPVFFLFGLLGLAEFDAAKGGSRLSRQVRLAWPAALAMLSLGFVALGARSYAEDVAFIDGEMVVSAKWAAAHLPAGAVIAAHDIGALGYFDDHPLIDLAGLVSPEVIPFMRDEARLAQYLDRSGAAYLVAFPDFYPHLTSGLEPLFTTGLPLTHTLGGENMTIYRWNNP